jgi:hypothetical protein
LRALAALGLGGAIFYASAPALALVDATAVDGQPNSDKLRTGGSSASFKAQIVAGLSNFQTVTRVFRMCGTSAKLTGDNCDGSGGGKLQDFAVIQGFFWDSTVQANGFGIPGGNGGVEGTIRISSNGSGKGLTCAGTQAQPGDANGAGIGYLMPEGPDGVPNTTDDAGGAATFGTVGAGAAPSAGFPQGAAPLTACVTKLLMAPLVPSTTTVAGALERCVVQTNSNNNGTIDGATSGNCTLANASTCTVTETTNAKLTCDLGLADIPPADFDVSSINGLSFNPTGSATAFGSIIFKFIASQDVHATSGTGTDKVQLFIPQVQNILAPAASSSVCSWDALGATATTGGSGATAFNMNVCYRDQGSGTRATTIKTVMVATEGTKQIGQDTSVAPGGGSGTGTQAPLCIQPGSDGTKLNHKFFYQEAATSDEQSCVRTHTAAFGFVDGDITPDTTTAGNHLWYNVPFEGVDPDTNVLKTAVKCGQYRFWGALSGGDGARCISAAGGSCSNAFSTAHQRSLTEEALYDGTLTSHLDAYLPFGSSNTTGTAYTKGSNNTDGFFNLKYRPVNACKGAPVAPQTIPQP